VRRDAARAHRLGARLGHRREHAPFVRGIAFDRLDETGNEIVPQLELDIDVGEGAVPRLSQGHQPIEQEGDEKNGDA